MPHYYNVLGWFHVTDVWCEKWGGLQSWMVRLEKIDLDNKSWWSPATTPHPPVIRDFSAYPRIEKVCNVCRVASKVMYEAGWTCLEQSCPEHFRFYATDEDQRIGNSIEVPDHARQYSTDFMMQRSPYAGSPPGPLSPELPTESGLHKHNYFGIEKIFARGIVCPQCQCASRRIEWKRWTCENSSCSYSHSVIQRPVNIVQAAESKDVKAMCSPEIAMNITAKGRYNVYQYTIPGPNGSTAGMITHYASDSIINTQADGPNDLFKEMQEKDFKLKRRPARLKGSM